MEKAAIMQTLWKEWEQLTLHDNKLLKKMYTTYLEEKRRVKIIKEKKNFTNYDHDAQCRMNGMLWQNIYVKTFIFS